MNDETRELVTLVRLELYSRGLPCGPKAIRARLEKHYTWPPVG